MTDALGLRAVFSVVLPATNSIAEPDMAAQRPPGVSNQTFRFPLPGRPDNLDTLLELMRPTVALALDCQPDRIVVGYTSEFLADGITVASRLRAFVEKAVGRPTTLASDALPEALDSLMAWVACIADAQPVDGYTELLRAAGFRMDSVTTHDNALTEMVNQIRGKLLGLEIAVGLKKIDLPDVDFTNAKQMVKAAIEAIKADQLGYVLMTATRID